MKRRIAFILVFISVLTIYRLPAQERAGLKVITEPVNGAFPLVKDGRAATVYVDSQDAEVVQIAAEAFKGDVERLTGTKVQVSTGHQQGLSGFPVIIGTLGQSALIDQLVKKKAIKMEEIKGKWESYSIAVVEQPFENVDMALVIAGSDKRGTAFGVFELSRLMGVSPWYWWADVNALRGFHR